MSAKQRERSLNISTICSCLRCCTAHRKAWKYLIGSDLSHPAIETPPAPLRYSSGTLKTEDRIFRIPKRSNGARFVPNALTMFVRVKARTIRMCKECWLGVPRLRDELHRGSAGCHWLQSHHQGHNTFDDASLKGSRSTLRYRAVMLRAVLVVSNSLFRELFS
jgi:hypothetical protein